MSGHNKWTQIKHQKSVTDKKRGVVFSKILKAVSIAARAESDPQFNPRLRSLMEKARQCNVPQDTIARAIKRTAATDQFEELSLEAYGPAGVALIINCITDSRNRTVAEIKHLLGEHDAKLAEPGAVRWNFAGDRPKFLQETDGIARQKIQTLITLLEEREDVQRVTGNLKL